MAVLFYTYFTLYKQYNINGYLGLDNKDNI